MNKRFLLVFTLSVLYISQCCVLSFGIKDESPPIAVESNIFKNKKFKINESFVVKFNENILAGKDFSNITIKSSQGSVKINKTILKNTLTLQPVGKYNFNTNYQITMPANSIKDSFGNNIKKSIVYNISTVQEWNFPVLKEELALSEEETLEKKLNKNYGFVHTPLGDFNFEFDITKNSPYSYYLKITGNDIMRISYELYDPTAKYTEQAKDKSLLLIQEMIAKSCDDIIQNYGDIQLRGEMLYTEFKYKNIMEVLEYYAGCNFIYSEGNINVKGSFSKYNNHFKLLDDFINFYSGKDYVNKIDNLNINNSSSLNDLSYEYVKNELNNKVKLEEVFKEYPLEKYTDVYKDNINEITRLNNNSVYMIKISNIGFFDKGYLSKQRIYDVDYNVYTPIYLELSYEKGDVQNSKVYEHIKAALTEKYGLPVISDVVKIEQYTDIKIKYSEWKNIRLILRNGEKLELVVSSSILK